jgi:membrane-bound lytic murein transglycosylase D
LTGPTLHATVPDMSRRRIAAAGTGLAFLLAMTAAQAADPHGPRPKSPATRHSTEGGTRRSIAGAPTAEETSAGAETAELRALREADAELFPPAAPSQGSPWPSELPFAMPGEPGAHVHATGVPPASPPAPPSAEAGKDRAWLAKLDMPDLPVRWDDRVVRYLEFFRDDPRGHATFASLFRRSGRWRDLIRRTLRGKSLPEDLVWVAMMESGFEPVARSAAGAVGVWQLMPETAKIYGLSIDRWVDQRMSAQLATEAAADLLADLHRRFGSWDLAMAAYNMGYGGLASVVKRYNTNDFWSLERTEGTLPWETTLYVPKILASAVIAHNLAAFGFGDLQVEGPIESDEVNVPAGTPLALVAQAAGCTPREVEALNPELRAARTPPPGEGEGAYPVRVPRGKGEAATQGLAKVRAGQPPLERYVVRFGETLDQIAAARRTTVQKLVELNAIAPGEAVRGGTVLLVPHVDAPATGPVAGMIPVSIAPGATALSGGSSASGRPTVVVPADEFVYPDRRRVFYRVQVGDTLREIAAVLHVTVDDLDRWNDVDPSARLQEGMTLQAFVPQGADLGRVVVASEADVHILPLGSEEFFSTLEHDKGFKRIVVTARTGDTLESIGRRFDVPARTMERVNRRGRGEALREGDQVVVYAPLGTSGGGAVATSSGPTPNGPLPLPPLPDLLP